MGRLTVSDEDLRALEVEAEVLYRTFKWMVAEDKFVEPGARSSIRCLCEDNLGAHLLALTKGVNNLRYLKKPGTRGKKLVRPLLHYFLVSNQKTIISEPQLNIIEDLNDGMGGLQAYVDAEDIPGPGHGEVYKRILLKTKELRATGEHGLILNALDYTRENVLLWKNV